MNTTELAIHVPLWAMIGVPALVALIVAIYFFKKLSFAIKFGILATIWYLGAGIYTRYLFLNKFFFMDSLQKNNDAATFFFWALSPIAIPLKLGYDLILYGFSVIDVYLK